MISTIRSLPLVWAIGGYLMLVLGTIAVGGFLFRITHKRPWRSTAAGRHLVAMSANIGAFFVTYLFMAFWPDFPGRQYVLLGLLLGLVINCWWRWILLEMYLRRKRRRKRERK